MGHNIAIVSPRVDVIIEISHRIKDAFIDERIDVLHQSVDSNIMVILLLLLSINY